MKNILNGNIYIHQLDGWSISWESDGDYRHWCLQSQSDNENEILLVMINPGSLSGDGKNLRRDTTLRIIREAFSETGANPFIINLFDYATPSPNVLFENWSKKDNKNLVFTEVKKRKFSAIMYAYGDYENNIEFGSEVKNRISHVREEFKYLPEVVLPKNNSGSPKHPMIWQTQGIKGEIHKHILSFFESKNDKKLVPR
jgi:hypothetical protein